MRTTTALMALHEALGAALLRDLPDQTYEVRDVGAELDLKRQISEAEFARRRAAADLPKKKCTRRPYEDEVDVVLFPQSWGSSTLGFGGVGGQATTHSYTVLVSTPEATCVYTGGSALLYLMPLTKLTPKQRAAWQEAVSQQMVPSRREAVTSFGAVLPEGCDAQ